MYHKPLNAIRRKLAEASSEGPVRGMKTSSFR
jgi:hypothetical protein